MDLAIFCNGAAFTYTYIQATSTLIAIFGVHNAITYKMIGAAAQYTQTT